MPVARGAAIGVSPMTVLVTKPQQSSSPDTGALVAAALGGDTEAFATLYDRYGQNVYNLVLRSMRHPQTAEDVCQEVWIKVYRELSGLRDHAAFSTWLYRIAARACVDTARKRAVAATTELPEQVAAPSHEAPDVAAIHHEQERLVWEAMGTLPPRQHLSLFLREVEGRNYREIAEIMETSESAIETLLFRARRGVAEAYDRLQHSRSERCDRAQQAMAMLIDSEGTPVQRQAVAAHVEGCRTCRGQLDGARRASAAYGVLPMLPVPAFLAQRIFEQIAPAAVVGVSAGAGASASAGVGTGGAAKLAALLAAKSKLFLATMTITGGITAGALLSPADVPPSARQALTAGEPAGQATDATTASVSLTFPLDTFADASQDGPGLVLLALLGPVADEAAGKLQRAVEQAAEAGRALAGGLPSTGDVTDALPGAPDLTGTLPDGGGLPVGEPPLPIPPAPLLPPTPPPSDVGELVPDPAASPPPLSAPALP